MNLIYLSWRGKTFNILGANRFRHAHNWFQFCYLARLVQLILILLHLHVTIWLLVLLLSLIRLLGIKLSTTHLHLFNSESRVECFNFTSFNRPSACITVWVKTHGWALVCCRLQLAELLALTQEKLRWWIYPLPVILLSHFCYFESDVATC